MSPRVRHGDMLLSWNKSYTTVRNRDDRRPRGAVDDTNDASESFESKLPRPGGGFFCGDAAVSRSILSRAGATTLSRDRRFRGGRFRRRGAGDAAAAPRMSARNDASSS